MTDKPDPNALAHTHAHTPKHPQMHKNKGASSQEGKGEAGLA